MKVTHAMEATNGPRTYTIARYEDGTYGIHMLTKVEGEEPVTKACLLSQEAIELLADATEQFLAHINDYKANGDET